MKAHIRHGLVSGTQTQEKAAPAHQEKAQTSRAEHIAKLKAQVRARSDGEARIARVKKLQAQIEAGTYEVDSDELAQALLRGSPLVPTIDDMQYDILDDDQDE